MLAVHRLPRQAAVLGRGACRSALHAPPPRPSQAGNAPPRQATHLEALLYVQALKHHVRVVPAVGRAGGQAGRQGQQAEDEVPPESACLHACDLLVAIQGVPLKGGCTHAYAEPHQRDAPGGC